MTAISRAMIAIPPLAALTLLCACFRSEQPELSVGLLAYEPDEATAPDNWVIETFDLPIECPEEKNSRFYLVYPGTETPEEMPLAVVFHSGSFDYVLEPSDTTPLAGAHYYRNSRLSRDWAVRQIFVTLGVYPGDPGEVHTGTLIASLARQGIAVLLPANCWGDQWHNVQGTAENSFPTDKFFRNGRGAAEWSWRVAAEPGFAESAGVTLPFTVGSSVYAIGLGEGGRAVSELLNAGYSPTGVLVDSPPDDLSPYWDDPVFSSYTEGLERLYPGEDTAEKIASSASGSLATAATLPDRTIYVYSSIDPQLPLEVHSAAIERLDSLPEAWVYDVGISAHVVSNRNPMLADDLVEHLAAVEPAEADTGE